MPISTMSAPFATISLMIVFVVSKSGSPAVMKGMNALCLKAAVILFMDVNSLVSCDCCNVLIATARQTNNDDFFGVQRRRQNHSVRDCM